MYRHTEGKYPMPGDVFLRTIFMASTLLVMACGASSVDFDKDKWASGTGNYSGKNPRLSMVGDIKHSVLDKGTPRSDVVELLGKPDSKTPVSDTWYLGRNDIAPDYQTLKVDYDAANTVSKYSIINS